MIDEKQTPVKRLHTRLRKLSLDDLDELVAEIRNNNPRLFSNLQESFVASGSEGEPTTT